MEIGNDALTSLTNKHKIQVEGKKQLLLKFPNTTQPMTLCVAINFFFLFLKNQFVWYCVTSG